jgi:ureidoglycolate hydrolase
MADGVRLPVKDLSEDAFRAFGRVLERPPRAADASGPGWSWWGETLLLYSDGRPFGVGMLDLQPGQSSFDWAERHMRSLEAIVPLDADILVYVGPPENLDRPESLPALERFEVFRVPRGRGIVLDPGVWHGAPLALDVPSGAVVLLLEGTGREDTTVVRFDSSPVTIARD